jgi:hypothetical protein
MLPNCTRIFPNCMRWTPAKIALILANVGALPGFAKVFA